MAQIPTSIEPYGTVKDELCYFVREQEKFFFFWDKEMRLIDLMYPFNKKAYRYSEN